MLAVLLIPAALLPSVLWLLVMQWWDRHEPEPPRLLARLFLAGVVGALIIGILRVLGHAALASAGILAPLNTFPINGGFVALGLDALLTTTIQQCVILFITVELTKRERAFSQPIDGIVYATTVAWGIALIENGIALVRNLFLPTGENGFSSLVFQLVFTTLLLGVAAGCTGLALGRARYRPRAKKYTLIAFGLLEAITLSVLFRILLESSERQLAGALVIVASVYLFSRFAIPTLLSPSERLIEK